jgi:hypothetical protein
VSVWFRINKMDMEILARPSGVDWEPYALHPELGEFYLTKRDEIEMWEGDGEWFPVSLAYVIAWFNTPIS